MLLRSQGKRCGGQSQRLTCTGVQWKWGCMTSSSRSEKRTQLLPCTFLTCLPKTSCCVEAKQPRGEATCWGSSNSPLRSQPAPSASLQVSEGAHLWMSPTLSLVATAADAERNREKLHLWISLQISDPRTKWILTSFLFCFVYLQLFPLYPFDFLKFF